MFVCMRTTLVLEDVAVEEIRKISFLEKKTISEIVNGFLMEGLRRRREIKLSPQKSAILPSFHMGVPRIDISDRDALNDVMDL